MKSFVYPPFYIQDITMSKVKLTVINSERNKNSTYVHLTESQMNKLGRGNRNLLSGDRVTVVGPNGSFTGLAWPDSRSNGDIPLSPAQQSEIGAVPDSTVTVKSGNKTSRSGNSRSTNAHSKPTTVQSSEEDDSNDKNNVTFGDVSYDDVGGLDSELSDIRQMVELPLRRPDLFKQVGVDSPKGVLMHGPPGTGKTLIAQAIANQTNARFTKIDGPEIMSKYTGESEERLRKIFTDARESGTAIIFFDEIDSIGTERGEGGDAENRLVGQLLSLMDGLDSDDDVIVIGATNRVDSIDPALRRSGRFDREILIGAPNETGRKEILDIHTNDMNLSDDVDIDALASQTNGFVGADLAALSREAALDAIQKSFGDDVSVEDVLNGEITEIQVTMEQFNRAMSRVEPTALRSMSTKTPSTTYEDVGGLENEKQQMEEIVAWPLKQSKLFNATNTDSPSGVIIHGDNGVGKTLLAEATAGEYDVNFTVVNGASIFQKYIGESEEKIEDLFDTAEQASPVIIFFEQLDAIAGVNASDSSGVQERVISQLLTELDTIRNDPTMTVIGETKEIDNIDSRLLQTGRFEDDIEIGLPDTSERTEILKVLVNDKPLDDDVDIGEIVVAMDKYEVVSGGNIESIVRNASLKSIREHANKYGDEADKKADDILITKEHFEQAIERVLA